MRTFCRALILENGLIRTLDPQVPTQRALAIAGERIAGGVGVHETALASPETVDLGGRVVVPGFSDSHVHFPTWALAQTPARPRGMHVARRGTRAERRAADPGAHDSRLRWRAHVVRGQPTESASIEVTGDTPAALIAKDYHSLWLNSAALALAGGDLEVGRRRRAATAVSRP